ncbi:MAG: TlpA family protein disulfide reductase [Prevotella sp.]|jgi:thiol-disulfide isomerase/thioredoxin|nr:TlpA family protein disulfide reductase [Prevotella sp.]
MKKLIKISLLSLLSLLIFIIISPLRGGYIDIGGITGFMLSSITGFIVYFVFTYFISSKYDGIVKPLWVLIAIFLGASIIPLFFHIRYWESTLISLPDYCIHLLGILLGFTCFKLNKVHFKVLLGIVSLSVAFWLSIPGYDMWLNKLNYGTFTGKVESTVLYPLIFQNPDGDTLNLEMYKGKYLILDCWYTYCGVCYKKFPKVQELYDKYKGSEHVALYSMHSRMADKKEDFKTGTNILKEEGYIFPSFSIDINDPILKELKVDAYPTVLIFDKDSQLIFRGSIEFAEKLIEKLVNE